MNPNRKRQDQRYRPVLVVLALLFLAACNQIPEVVPEDASPNLAPTALKYVLEELEGLPGGSYALALAASADGSVIAGQASNSAGQTRAVKWNAAGRITELVTLEGGGLALP